MIREMNPQDIRMAGGAPMWGAAAFIIGRLSVTIGCSRPWGISVVLITFLSMPLLVVGLLGAQNQYGEKIGGFGKTTC